MCVKEFLGYDCGHCSVPYLLRCPITAQNPQFSECDIPAERPIYTMENCHPCSRVVWNIGVLAKEEEHRLMHLHGECFCETIFDREEHDRGRSRVAGGDNVGAREPPQARKSGDNTGRVGQYDHEHEAEKGWIDGSGHDVERRGRHWTGDGAHHYHHHHRRHLGNGQEGKAGKGNKHHGHHDKHEHRRESKFLNQQLYGQNNGSNTEAGPRLQDSQEPVRIPTGPRNTRQLRLKWPLMPAPYDHPVYANHNVGARGTSDGSPDVANGPERHSDHRYDEESSGFPENGFATYNKYWNDGMQNGQPSMQWRHRLLPQGYRRTSRTAHAAPGVETTAPSDPAPFTFDAGLPNGFDYDASPRLWQEKSVSEPVYDSSDQTSKIDANITNAVAESWLVSSKESSTSASAEGTDEGTVTEADFVHNERVQDEAKVVSSRKCKSVS